MNAELLDLLCCAAPDCGGRLAVADRDGLVLACRRCPARYPVLADVPIVVPSPVAYLASYRDAVLATLADAGRATRRAVEVVHAFADAGGATEPLAFGDDWVAREDARPAPATDDVAITAWLARAPDTQAHLAALVPARAAIVVELGCGASGLAAALAAPDRHVVAADLSLRAVVRTIGPRRRRALSGAVVDAEALPLRPRSIDALVAANLIDLLERPDRFLAATAAALTARGAAILATPEPALGTDDDATFAHAVIAAGLTVDDYQRGVPWLRGHSPRHYQLYFTDVAVAIKRRLASRTRLSGRGRSRGRADAPPRPGLRRRDRGRGRSRARAGARRPSS